MFVINCPHLNHSAKQNFQCEDAAKINILIKRKERITKKIHKDKKIPQKKRFACPIKLLFTKNGGDIKNENVTFREKDMGIPGSNSFLRLPTDRTENRRPKYVLPVRGLKMRLAFSQMRLAFLKKQGAFGKKQGAFWREPKG